MCLVGAVVALMGCFFERLPRGVVSFGYFRRQDDVSPKLMRRSKVWLIATGAAAALIAAIGIWTQIFWLEMLVPLVVLLAGGVAMYALWLQGAPKSVRYVVWPALAITLGLVCYMMVQGLAQTRVEVGDSVLQINGMYSLEIPYDQIERIDLSSEPPHATLRTNGFAANGICKGYFKLEGGERCFLDTDARISTYIYVYRKNDFPVVFNVGDDAQTRLVFERLNEANRNLNGLN